MSNDKELCREIAGQDSNILGVGIIENLVLKAIFAKPGVPLPKEDKFSLMFAQSEILISIAKSNTDFFGSFRYVVSSFEKSDIMFLPSRSKDSARDRIIVIQVLRPCDHEKISEAAMRVVSAP